MLCLVLSFILLFEFQHPIVILLFIFSFCAIGYFVVTMLPGVTKQQKLEGLIMRPKKLRHLSGFFESRAVKTMLSICTMRSIKN